LSGLDSRYRGAEHRRRIAETEARILELTRRGPTDGSTHWSSYRLAKEVGVSQSTVSRVWRQFGLQPHRSRSYMASDDPEFEEKAANFLAPSCSNCSRTGFCSSLARSSSETTLFLGTGVHPFFLASSGEAAVGLFSH
jgi:hypothetical protein